MTSEMYGKKSPGT